MKWKVYLPHLNIRKHLQWEQLLCLYRCFNSFHVNVWTCQVWWHNHIKIKNQGPFSRMIKANQKRRIRNSYISCCVTISSNTAHISTKQVFDQQNKGRRKNSIAVLLSTLIAFWYWMYTTKVLACCFLIIKQCLPCTFWQANITCSKLIVLATKLTDRTLYLWEKLSSSIKKVQKKTVGG